MILNFQLPARDNYYRTKPIEFLDYFVSGSNSGGLKDYLTSQKLINDMSSSVFIENRGFSNYLVDFDLPSEGERENGLKIVKVFLNYMNTLYD